MKCQVLIDWLTFSVKKDDPSEVIRDYLGLDPNLFQETGYSLLGYNRVLRFSDIYVCYEPRENKYFKSMGVCVSMSGNACRAFETMSKLTFEGATDKQGTESVAFPVLFQKLMADEGANISRIDIACDDREGYLDMDQIIKKTFSNEINSRLRRKTIDYTIDGVKEAGATVYIGAASSAFRVRIYDKALEQGEDGHWIRVELVMRAENANAFVEEMTNSESVGKLAAQVINDKFSFIERDDSNISRCTVCDWWENFVDELEAVRLVARCVIQHGIDHVRNWVEFQVGLSLYVLMRTTLPGTATYGCSLCGETKTETIPALGHNWQVKQTVTTQYDDTGQLTQQGYTIFECSTCHEQYKSEDGALPPGGGSGTAPGGDEGETIWDKFAHLIGAIGNGVISVIEGVLGKLLDALIALAEMLVEKLKTVVDAVLKIFDELPTLFGGFLDFLAALFPFLPPEFMTVLTFGVIAVVFIGIIKAVRR